MKQAINFRLSNHSTGTLSLLKQTLKISKTAIVEEALELYAKKKLSTKNPWLKHVGVLSDKDADEMLTAIKSDRVNKTLKVKL